MFKVHIRTAVVIINLIEAHKLEMKPTLVADEMFPEGAGPFMELDEVINRKQNIYFEITSNEIALFVYLFFIFNVISLVAQLEF